MSNTRYKIHTTGTVGTATRATALPMLTCSSLQTLKRETESKHEMVKTSQVSSTCHCTPDRIVPIRLVLTSVRSMKIKSTRQNDSSLVSLTPTWYPRFFNLNSLNCSTLYRYRHSKRFSESTKQM